MTPHSPKPKPQPTQEPNPKANPEPNPEPKPKPKPNPNPEPKPMLPSERDPRLWVIAGATGTGKSAAALELAESIRARGAGAEIVNADAMQVYRGMDIGTAKLTVAERRGIAHHLLDVKDPSEEATVAWYQPLARAAISRILDRGADAILVGGSGLYISSVVFDLAFPPRNDAVRAELEATHQKEGLEPLLDELRTRDAVTAAAIDQRNPRRVIRALEIARLGARQEAHLPDAPNLWQNNTSIFGLQRPRDELVRDLDERVCRMWQQGLLEEVKRLRPAIEAGKTASRAIGYAQALAQAAGAIDEAEAIAQTQVLTRRFARRQVSWFKRVPGLHWIDANVAGEQLRARID